MADNQTIAFSIKIEGVEREIKSIKDLKQAKKDATDAFLRGDKEAAKAIAELKDKTEDLTDATNTLKGSGVEKLNSSFNQLSDGFSNFDTEKIKLGFKGIGAAMSAIPIFLIIEGLKYLWENFDKVSEAVKTFFNVTSEAEKNIKKLEASVNSLREANSLLVTSLENEVKILEAQGGSQAKLLELRKRIVAEKIKEAEADVLLQKAKIAEILSNDSLIESYYRVGAANARRFGQDKEAAAFDALLAKEKNQRIKESTELLKADLITINNLKTEAKVAEIKNENEITKAYESELEKRKDAHAKYLEQKKKDAESFAQAEASLNETVKANRLKVEDETNVELTQRKFTQAELDRIQRQKDLEEFKENKEQQVAAAKAALQSTQALTDLYFNWQLNKNKKNKEEELRIRKQQFKVNKAFGVANSIIDGVGAIAKALNNPYPLNIILAVAAGVMATANTVKIASTKFDDGGGGSGGGGGDSAPSIPIPAAPTINTPNANPDGTKFDENGKKIQDDSNKRIQVDVKAQVVETEMTNKQQGVKQIEKQNTF